MRVESSLLLIFSMLDLQASIYLGLRAPQLGLQSLPSRLVMFESAYDEAEYYLNELVSKIWVFIRTTADDFRYRAPGFIPLEVVAEAEALREQLNLYHDQHLSLLLPTGKLSEVQAAMLEIKHVTALVLISTSIYAEEMIYDRFLPQFRTVVALAERIREPPHRGDKDLLSGPDFSLEMGIIHPLYTTAMKCRCPRTRQRAIELLDTMPRTEGVWEGHSRARIAGRIKQLEENGLGLQDSPYLKTEQLGVVDEQRRVHSADITTFAQRLAVVSFRLRRNGMDGEWDDIVEEIAW